MNEGTAPVYEKWPLSLYTVSGEKNDGSRKVSADGTAVSDAEKILRSAERTETDLDLTSLAGGEKTSVTVKLPSEDMPEGIWAGIEDPDTGKPAVPLDFDGSTASAGFCYRLK